MHGSVRQPGGGCLPRPPCLRPPRRIPAEYPPNTRRIPAEYPLHHPSGLPMPLEADAVRLRQLRHAGVDTTAVGRAAEGREGEWIDLGPSPRAATTCSANRCRRAAVKAWRRPAAGGEAGVEDAQVARQAVAVHRVEHQHAGARAQAAVAVEQVSLGVREE